VLAERFGITVEEDTNEELTARYNVSPSQLSEERWAVLGRAVPAHEREQGGQLGRFGRA
jgi:hypothetical protein